MPESIKPPFKAMALMITALSLALGTPQTVFGAIANDAALMELNIEDLMQVNVISAAKQEQPWADSAAAVFVITNEDIRRSGVTILAEALRLAPGVEAARIDAARWAITIRGFNGRFANKLLVMVDGRSVYTPAFSGVYWEIQDLPLADIDRIEVIRGPGGSLWGANAVNGVINIINKPARDTQGGRVSVTAGNEERSIVDARYGGKLGETAQYRLYGRQARRDGFVDLQGQDAGDDWMLQRGGFRLDWQPTGRDTVSVMGDVYDGEFDENMVAPLLTPPYAERRLDPAKVQGGSLQTVWERRYSEKERIGLQVYYQYEDHEALLAPFRLDTFDVDFQHSFRWGERQELIWGVNYRHYRDQFDPSELITLTPDSLSADLFSLFAQDQITLSERWQLTVGARMERNDYTGWEFQPSVRLLWKPDERQRVWAAVSRAVRTPSRAEEDARINTVTVPPEITGSLPGIVATVGDRGFDSEKLTAYEIGYRTWLGRNFSLDVAAFYNDYDDLFTGVQGTPSLEVEPLPPHLVLPLHFRNLLSDDNYGAEIAVDWHPGQHWRLQLNYSYLWSRPEERQWSPLNQVSLRSSWDLRDDLELDAWLYYVDPLESVSTLSALGAVSVDAHLNLTLRLGWRPYPGWELSLVGANLLDSEHLEMVQEVFTYPVEVERSLYGQVKWSF